MRRENIEDIYGLSPMQAGILFESLYAGERAVYLDQHAFELRGRLDERAFEQAWEYLIRRHSVLRTSFHWERVEEPVQVVHGSVALPLDRLDWSEVPAAELPARFDTFLAEDRAGGLEIGKAPLMRLTLIRLAPDSWRFVWIVHHLILDRWSIERLLSEFSSVYESLSGGRPIELPPVRPYSQYIAWIQGQDAARAEDYWRGRLAGFTGPTVLPIDRSPAGKAGAAGTAQGSVRLSESVTSDLLGFARRHHLTLNTLIQGAWAALLSRYSAQDKVLFGSTVSGRPPAIPGVESMVGLFINSLPVPVRLDGSARLVDWLNGLQNELAELREYEHSSLLQVQSSSDVPRGTPLFDSLVIVQNTPAGDSGDAGDRCLNGLKIQPIASESTVDFPLMLLAVPGRELSLWLSYDTGRYDAADIDRLLGHLCTILESFAADPGLTLNRLRMLTDTEQLKLAAWNRTERDYPLEGGIHELIEEQAARTPDAVAVVEAAVPLDQAGLHGTEVPSYCLPSLRDLTVTFGELNARANRLAWWLRKQGVGPDRLVGLFMERSAELVVAIVAVLKAGGAYVPLDPSYPSERVAGMVRDASPVVVLAQEHLGVQVFGCSGVISIEDAERIAAVESSENPYPVVCGDNLAYMIYTSGSTGTPKGAMNTHSGIRNRLLWMQDAYGLDSSDRVLQKTPFSFDVSVWEFLWPLMTGAALVMARPEGHKDPIYLSEVIESEGVTTLHFVPSMLRAFLAAGDLSRCKSLRRVICSGEALAPDLVAQFHEADHGLKAEATEVGNPAEAGSGGGMRVAEFGDPGVDHGLKAEATEVENPIEAGSGGVELHNLYGPTEAAIDVTYFACGVDDVESCVPIGRPIANTQIYILDRHMQPVPVGVPGELYIGGANVGRGYLNRADLTAERFVPNPFGSLGQMDGGSASGLLDSRVRGNDGYTSFGKSELRHGLDSPIRGDEEQLSTLNSQLSTRLYRTGDLCRYLPDGNIEFLGRLDHQVKIRGFRIELGEIETALLSHHSVRDCVVVAREDGPGENRLVSYVVGNATSGELRDHLKATLPDYMIPSAFVALESLPLSANGKVDRKLLPAPEFGAGKGTIVLPRTPVEEGLAEIWRDVLRIDHAGVHDSFFELGGHSLLATQVVSRIRITFQVDLPLRAVFEGPTIAELAAVIEKGRDSESITPITRADLQGPRPLSFAQQRLWFLDQLEPGNPVYNISNTVRLRGRMDIPALERALDEIVRRHESLRTTFVIVDGEPAQIVGEVSVGLEQSDLRNLPDKEEVARQRVEDEARQPFDLIRGPLLRASLLKLADDEHIFMITIHHIVADGWSLGVFANELAALYNAFMKGESSPLTDLPLQYSDFATWQRDWLQGEALDRQIDYWKEQLFGAPALLELPTDRPRPAVRTTNGARKRLDLSPRLTQDLKTLGQHEGATLFMSLLAGLQTLFYRYTGQDQIIIGTPIANRTRAETEGLIGLFANTLALRGDLSGNPTFAELLGRVRERCLGAYAHQDLPFEKLVDALQPERSTGHSPIFQVMFMLQNTPAEGEGFAGLLAEPARADSVTAKYDLVLGASESDGRLRLGLEYNSDLFDGDRIERLLGHLQTLLEAIVSNPKLRIAELPILTETEQRQILVEWNATECAFPDRRLHQLIEEQVNRTPDAVAVRFGDSRITYREMDERANGLAHQLRSLGVGPDSYVAVFMERSLELIPALLGVLKAGAAYVPLDPDYPAGRVAFMLEDSQARVIISQNSVAGRLPDHNAITVCVDGSDAPARTCEHPDGDVSYPSTRLDLAVDSEQPAYVIYTSGTTGRPKGVVVPHRAIVNHMAWTQQTYPLGPEDRALQKTPISFDASVWECWAPLMAGGELVVARPGGHMDAEYLVELIQEEGITAIKLVPSLLRMLVDVNGFADCASLRRVFCGAEALQKELHDRFFAVFGDRVQLANLYGPTEAAIDAVGYRCSGNCLTPTVPIGWPIANCTSYILDRNLQPVPVGVPGELYLGGANIARGYLNAAHLTADRFVPNPFGSDSNDRNRPLRDDDMSGGQASKSGGTGSELLDSRLRGNDETAEHRTPNTEQLSTLNSQLSTRLYRTGDRCRYLSDGSIEFLGRVDHQVKIRGFRIELVEIEGVLKAHRSVRDCVVVAREDSAGGLRLAAYVVGHPVEAAELRQHLKSQLPDYMIPGSFTILDSLPLTPAGKVDYKALPEPEQFAAEGDGEVSRNPAEELIIGIWEELLRRDGIGIHDNFFELGGHSLLATQVMARIRGTFDLDVPLRALFEHRTVAELAEVVDEARRAGAQLDLPPLLPRQGNEPAPLSFSQERLWFLYELERESYIYNMPRALRLTGDLDVEALQKALSELVARHEVVRTTYETRDGAAIQIVGPPVEVSLPLDEVDEDEIAGCCLQESTTPFDLTHDLMLRARLLRISERDHVLLLTVHHIASDGWSNGILMAELTHLYNALHAGESAALQPLPVQYSDFAAWQRRWVAGGVLARQVSYWKDRLSGAPPMLNLPTDRPRGAAAGHDGAMHRFLIPVAVADALRILSREERATQFMTLLAGFNALLHHWSGETDLVVGTDSAGRTLPEVEGLIGFFLNHLVLRTDLSGDPSFREAIRRVREVCLGAYAHQDLPFDKLVEAVQPERGVSHTPVFQVLFVMQNTPRGSNGALSGLEATRVESEFPASKYDLSMFLADTVRGVSGMWVYRTELFDESTISRLSRQYVWLLGELLQHPDRPIEDIEIPHDPVEASAEDIQFAAVKAVRRRAVVPT